MHQTSPEVWESLFIEYLTSSMKDQNDASHDLGHFRRVYYTAKAIADMESGSVDPLTILAAAYFHDIVSLPKNHPENHLSSRYAATKANEILRKMNFPQEKIEPVCHAIAAHSFSGGIRPETIEAQIVQDADRMEALGALGVMRTFYVSGRMERKPFDPDDLYAERRPLNDKLFGLDHFYVKLFKLPSLLQTKGGRTFANKRIEFLQYFVKELEENVKKTNGGALVLVNACYQAGYQNLQLFDSANPLAQNRPLVPDRFVVDQLVASTQQFPVFINKFMCQFQEEIL